LKDSARRIGYAHGAFYPAHFRERNGIIAGK